MNLGRRNRVKAEGGMSSMTDLVFLLLIFFIIMSTMTNRALPVDLPANNSENKNTKENSIVDVAVNANNEYFFDNDESVTYNFEEVKPVLESKMLESGEENLKIHGDKDAAYEYVFQLIALAKQKGWKPVLVYK
jgi:biopolymer transport protein ExbD